MVRRSVPLVSLVMVMLIATWLVLRPPDISQALAFFSDRIPTLRAGEAVMKVLAWLVVVAAACIAVVTMVKANMNVPPHRSSFSLASVFLTVGLLLLAVGAIQRALPAASLCCGSGPADIREAIRLAH
ncbi:MAG: hypothetical protein WB808_04750 [Candidatus Dormiibacterota bacterium]